MSFFCPGQIIDFLEQQVKLHQIPGAVIHISYQGEVFLQEAIGNRICFSKKAEMTLDTVFDLASLTKVVATVPAILKLIDTGYLSLSDKLCSYIPEWSVGQKKEIRVDHLLTHTSGLPSHKPYYLKYGSKEEILQQVYAQGLVAEPGERVIYSDLGMMILYMLVEKISGKPFEKYVLEEIFRPLEMEETCFNPLFPGNRYAATEFCPIRKQYLIGRVHDENAQAMGGVSGHAGLFSTLKDLANFVVMLENKGSFQHRRLFSAEIIELSRKNQTPDDPESRGFGWLLKNKNVYSPFGQYCSAYTYGHTGFTGTSMMIDPAIGLSVILLTNRVHFGRKEDIFHIRSQLHDLIYRSLTG